MHGFLNLDKPAGMTSHDVVARVRRLARLKRVGHAGTLDPAATGVLVVALGQATRLVEYVQEQTSKRYTAVVHLGSTTTTDDAAGAVLETRPLPSLDSSQIALALAQFRGTIQQVPPQFSAIHHQGRRLYELAREGTVVDLPARTVVIEQLTLLDWQAPLVTLDVQCSKGTYIRSLARDLGAALGCGGHLQALRRTAVGTFLLDAAVPLAALETGSVVLEQAVQPPEVAVADWPVLHLEADAARRVRNGQLLVAGGSSDERARAHTADGTLLALLRQVDGMWKPEKVFDWT